MKKIIKKLFLTLLVLSCLTLSIWGYLASHHFVNLDPNDEFHSMPIVSTKKIKISSYPKAYNPSILPYGEGYLLSFRVDSYNLKTKIQKWRDHRTSFVGVVLLNRNFDVIEPAQLIESSQFNEGKKNTPQDVRMISLNGQIYFFFNDNPAQKKDSQRMYFAELIKEGSKFRLKKPRTLLDYAGSTRRIEKNWTPFIYQNKLHIVYTIEPHIILEVNLDTGECQEVAKQSQMLCWKYGELRGGTPAILVGDEFISVFHSSKKGIPSLFSKKNGRVFYMGAYAFKNDPSFEITKITTLPYGKEYYKNNPKKVIFPGGILVEENRIHCVFGKDDEQLFVTTFDKNELLSSMHSL